MMDWSLSAEIARQFYASPAQQPLLLWFLQALSLGILLFWRAVQARRSKDDRLAVTLILLAALDAGLTSLDLAPALKTFVSLVFVLLGDWRVLFWITRDLRLSAVVTFGVPVVSYVVGLCIPILSSGRPRFLFYEVLIVLMGNAWWWLWARHRYHDRAYAWWLAMAPYALWIIADVGILFGSSSLAWAWSLRIAANCAYYVMFVPTVWAMSQAKGGRQ